MTDTDSAFYEILPLLKENPRGMSVTEIADAVHTNRNTAARYMDKLLVSGKVEMRTFGKAKVFFISKRVPVSAMLNLSSEMVLLIDADLKVIQVNASLLSFLNIEPADVIGAHIFEGACRVFCNDILTEQIRRALQGEAVKGEIRLLHNGRDRCLEERISPMVLSDGRPGVTLILDDITEKVNAKEALEESEAMFRRLVETVNDVIWSLDENSCIQYISPQAERVLGYTTEELAGKKFSEYMPEGAARRFDWELESVISRDNGFTLSEFPIYCKDGSKIYCEFTGTPVVVEGDGNVFLGYTGAMRDVTDRRNAELGAKRWKYFLDAVIDNIPSLIAVIDQKSRKIVYVNERTEDIIGYPEDQMTLLTWDEFATELKADILTETLRQVEETGESSKQFADVITFSGKRYAVNARVVHFSLSVELEYMVIILSDVVQL